MDNPYRGYTEAEHCTEWFAHNEAGGAVRSHSPFAVKWCALGALNKSNVPSEQVMQFWDWVEETFHHGISVLNDMHGWTFAQFADAWDRWQSEAGK